MSNIRTFISKEDIHQQACEWISKIDRGLDIDEKVALTLWVNTSDSHKQSLFEVATLFDELSVLHELSGLFPLRGKETRIRKTYTPKVRWGIAAGFVCLMVTSITLSLNSIDFNQSEDPSNPVARYAETGIGEQKPVTLTDGSVIHLNTNTRLNVTYTNTQRRINLEKGEAHFDVAHDPSRPFIVAAGSNTVTAVGTAFNVQLFNDSNFELLVTEGKVVVKEGALRSTSPSEQLAPQHPFNGEGVLMSSGEKAIFDGTRLPKVTLSLDQVQRDLAWQQGMVVFQGEPLEQALMEVSRYNAIHFEISDQNVRDTRVAGYFKAGDIEGLLYALKNNFDIQHQVSNDGTIVLSSGL